VFAAIGWKVLDRFRFGSSFAISPHGCGIAVGYLCGSLIFMHEGPKRGVEEQVSSLVLWGLIGRSWGRAWLRAGPPVAVPQRRGRPGRVPGGASASSADHRWIIASIPSCDGVAFDARRVRCGGHAPVSGDRHRPDRRPHHRRHLGKPTDWLLGSKYHAGTSPATMLVRGAGVPGPALRGQQQVITSAERPCSARRHGARARDRRAPDGLYDLPADDGPGAAAPLA